MGTPAPDAVKHRIGCFDLGRKVFCSAESAATAPDE
jgi:hypothetical protein